MYSLEGILKLADNELSSMVSNGKFRSRDDVEMAYKLTDIVKDVYCIWAYEEDEGGSSFEGGSYRSYRGSYEGGGRSNEGGRSYERGGGRSRAGRDNMGRFSREGSYRGRSNRGYSRDDGKMEYIEELRELMEDAPDEQTRQSIQRMIQQMENA